MFHLEYPRKQSFFQWDELACLSRALGFPGEIFYNNIPEEYTKDNENNGLSLKILLFLINVQKCFNRAVDRTINIHTDEWNLCVIKKALHLLDINAITYEELHSIRVAFQTYENADTKGLPLNEKTLQRTLKLCNRMISPLKMMQRIKHMKDDFEEDGRIQLHEFLDLILWCEIYEQLEVSDIVLDITKDSVDLYNMQNFEDLLTHYDDLLAQRLNNEYRAAELTFVKEKHSSKALPKDVPPVDPEKRKRQVTFHRENYHYLKNELLISQKSCHLTKAGYVRGRPITAPDLIMYDAISQGYRVSTLDPRPATVYETIGHLIRPMSRAKTPIEDIRAIVPRPEIPKYKRPVTPATVSPGDKVEHIHRMQTLDFEIALVEHKYEQLLQEEMDEFMPGYRERLKKRPKVVDTGPEKVPLPPREQIPGEETLHRLSYHHKREPPRPAHSKACDARYRGWHKVRTKRGSHHVLIEPFHERTNTGLLYTKLRQQYRQEGDVDMYVHRVTTGNEVQLEKPKSRAKKYGLMMPETDRSEPESHKPSVRPPHKGSKQSLVSSSTPGHKGSKQSLTSKDSSEVSWRHLKLYKEEPVVEEDPQSKKPERAGPGYDPVSGRVVDLGTVGRVEVLEKIKEESGRTTRQSGVGKTSKTPQVPGPAHSNLAGRGRVEMSHLARNFDAKLQTSSEPPISEHAIPPIKQSLAPPAHSTSTKVKVMTPASSMRETLGLGGSFYDSLPLKTSTADNPLKRHDDRIKLKCLRRLSTRVDGLVSRDLHRKLLTVDLSSLGMPNPGGQKWGGVTVSV